MNEFWAIPIGSTQFLSDERNSQRRNSYRKTIIGSTPERAEPLQDHRVWEPK